MRYHGEPKAFGANAPGAVQPSCQLFHWRAILFVGERDCQCQQMLQRVHRDVDFASLALFMAVRAGVPLSGVDCSVRLSRMTAPGSAFLKNAAAASKTVVHEFSRLGWQLDLFGS